MIMQKRSIGYGAALGTWLRLRVHLRVEYNWVWFENFRCGQIQTIIRNSRIIRQSQLNRRPFLQSLKRAAKDS